MPDWHTSQAGPFDLWPTGLGFEYFYGFLGGDANQWHTALYENTRPVAAEEQRGDQPVHFDQLMADHAIAWLRMQHAVAPNKPFFVYYAPGTAHAPHHAPKEWIAKFTGQFDRGWDQVREETYARQKQLGIIPADAKLTEVKAQLRQRQQRTVPEQGTWLRSVLLGHYHYYGVPLNAKALQRFQKAVTRLWQRSLSRRSQKGAVTWERMQRYVARWIPAARC